MKPFSIQETATLIQAARKGSDDAIDTLFRRYWPIVLRIVELRTKTRIRGDPGAEDIAQESLVEAFEGLGRFEQRSDGDFRNWLARIVENNIRDDYRRKHAQKRGGGRVRRFADLNESSLSESVFAGNDPTPSANIREAELEQRLEHVIAHELPEDEREVIILRRICLMSYEEIAVSMGHAGPSTSRSLYSRAMKRLRTAL